MKPLTAAIAGGWLLASATATHAAGARDGWTELVALVQPCLPPAEVDAAALETLAQGLAARGVRTPELARLLEEGLITAPARTDGGPRALLPPAVAEVLTGALCARPSAELSAHYGRLAGERPSDAARDLGLRVLGASGQASDLTLLMYLASPPAGESGVPRRRRLAFETALAEVLSRHPGTVTSAGALFEDAESSLVTPLVRAVASVETPQALRVLTGCLSRRAGFNPLLLSEITQLAERVPHPVDEYVLSGVRLHLDSARPGETILAANALGALEDYDAVPRLIGLLEAEDTNLRAAGSRALERVTLRSFGADAAAWARWYEDELDWWVHRSGRAFADLRSRDPHRTLSAVREVSERRMFRPELADELVGCLSRSEVEVVLVACRALGDLRSEVAVPELVRSLSHRDARVSAAALQSLRAITGLDHPADPEAWSPLL